jgi:hypothetical protein
VLPAAGAPGTACDKAYRKFFLRSLPFTADENALRGAFLPLGDVEEVVVVPNVRLIVVKRRQLGFQLQP